MICKFLFIGSGRIASKEPFEVSLQPGMSSLNQFSSLPIIISSAPPSALF